MSTGEADCGHEWSSGADVGTEPGLSGGSAAHLRHGGAERVALDALMARAGRGDRKAFAALYDATVDRVYGLILCILGDRELGEQVTRQVYAQAWHTARLFDAEAGSALSSVIALAHRHAVRLSRSADADLDRRSPIPDPRYLEFLESVADSRQRKARREP